MRLRPVLRVAVVAFAGAAACSRQPPAPDVAQPSRESPSAEVSTRPSPLDSRASAAEGAPPGSSAAREATADAPPSDDPMAIHFAAQTDLLRLVPLPPLTDERAVARRDALLSYLVAPSPGHFNDGNRALAHHSISRAACMAGLKDVVLQTDEQRAICKGEPYMVPVYANGDLRSARVCIDEFEFPDVPCELPFVWGSPSEAESICKAEGKRLCSQQEWTLACTADPTGKDKRPYAYGDTLDMTICNTNKPHEAGPDGKAWNCNVHDASSAWNTCSTDTEPGGAFPRCRSRLGVFDQHGNVAEIMSRAEDGETYTQLKGSAFFYTDVAREPGKAPLHPERESYPDTCGYDPRWHVEKLSQALHVNYHLGFRCCKAI